MKKIAIMAAMGAVFATGVQAAGNGTINFTGKVVAQTCDASVNGTATPATATVALPTVQSNVLAAAGNTAGQTSFNMALTNCATLTGANTVKAYFEKGATVDANGRLINQTATGSGGASNVVLELVDGTGNTAIRAGDASQSTGNYVAITSGAATLPYSVRYYATGQSTAGTVTSNVTYSLIYN